jgi:hypothetical protein
MTLRENLAIAALSSGLVKQLIDEQTLRNEAAAPQAVTIERWWQKANEVADAWLEKREARKDIAFERSRFTAIIKSDMAGLRVNRIRAGSGLLRVLEFRTGEPYPDPGNEKFCGVPIVFDGKLGDYEWAFDIARAPQGGSHEDDRDRHRV